MLYKTFHKQNKALRMQFRRVVHEAQSVLLVLALKFVCQHLYGIFANEDTPREFVMRNLNMLILAGAMQGTALVLGVVIFALDSMSTAGPSQAAQTSARFHALFARTAIILPSLCVALFIVTLEDTHRFIGEDSEVQDLLEIIFNGMIVLFSVNFVYALQTGLTPTTATNAKASAVSNAATPSTSPQITLLIDASFCVGLGVRFFRVQAVSQAWVLVVGMVHVVVLSVLFLLDADVLKLKISGWIRPFFWALVRVVVVSVYLLVVIVFLGEQGLFVNDETSVLTTRARLLRELAVVGEKLPVAMTYLERYRADTVWVMTLWVVLGVYVAGLLLSWVSVAIRVVETRGKQGKLS